jgi:hypothetical protein
MVLCPLTCGDIAYIGYMIYIAYMNYMSHVAYIGRHLVS